MSEQRRDWGWFAIELLLPLAIGAVAFWRTGNGWLTAGMSRRQARLFLSPAKMLANSV